MANFQEELSEGRGTSVTVQQGVEDRSTASVINAASTAVEVGLELRDQYLVGELRDELSGLSTQDAETVKGLRKDMDKAEAARKQGSRQDPLLKAQTAYQRAVKNAPHLSAELSREYARFSKTPMMQQAQANADFQRQQEEALLVAMDEQMPGFTLTHDITTPTGRRETLDKAIKIMADQKAIEDAEEMAPQNFMTKQLGIMNQMFSNINTQTEDPP